MFADLFKILKRSTGLNHYLQEEEVNMSLGDGVRSTLLYTYCFVTNYRFRKFLKQLQVPSFYSELKVEEIRAKATASLTSVSAFLGFTVAVLVPLALWDKFTKVFEFGNEKPLTYVLAWAALAFILPYSTFWFERYVSAASVEEGSKELRLRKRGKRSTLMVLCLLAALFLFLGAPLVWPNLQEVLKTAFPMAGAFMILLSGPFLVAALEFYDSCSGWRGTIGWHFHLASMASHSYMLGISLALTGVALNVCLLNFRAGRIIASGTLCVLIMMVEIERELWDLANVKEHAEATPPA